MKNINLLQEEIERIQGLHESATKKLDFSRFEFTINESEEKLNVLNELMESCGSMMYEIACTNEGTCMESYGKMCETLNEMMESYGEKCKETSLKEGWVSEEDLSENPALMSLGRAAAAGAGSAMVNKIMDETEEVLSGDMTSESFKRMEEIANIIYRSIDYKPGDEAISDESISFSYRDIKSEEEFNHLVKVLTKLQNQGSDEDLSEK